MHCQCCKAKYWYEKAVSKGHASAMTRLGDFYYHGMAGISDSKENAITWYRLAASQGHVEACARLHYCYWKHGDLLGPKELGALQLLQNTVPFDATDPAARPARLLGATQLGFRKIPFAGRVPTDIREELLALWCADGEVDLGTSYETFQGLAEGFKKNMLNPPREHVHIFIKMILDLESPSILYSGDWKNEQGAEAFQAAFQSTFTLSVLNLRYKKIGGVGAHVLANVLKENHSLVVLNLEGNDILKDGAQALSESIKVNSTLREIYLRGNRIGNDGAKSLALALNNNSVLTTLSIDYNKIGDAGVQAIADTLLKDNFTMRVLNLGGNRIRTDGAIALAKTLGLNSRLERLNLEHNKIGSDGARALSQGLKTNKSLNLLNLYGNLICDVGAEALGEALKTNCSVRILHAGGNSIGARGVGHLADALLCNSTLTELYLGENSFGDDGLERIATALKSNTSLEHLDVNCEWTLNFRRKPRLTPKDQCDDSWWMIFFLDAGSLI
ncbi:RNI-like protein [Gonapodya prolifera JEL478]|uniref:RNI-like protein n=1 Tax=Gonapodya prolifera (strain JEL478) TaxID=1344416 RepID=A0A139ADI3_GONPJ|nr:RNI-like protein [Gonapodya prolifera JEL478]|eukprot:KXS14886.1 RNI-like protein [Gonapodya prolifera JEL478]